MRPGLVALEERIDAVAGPAETVIGLPPLKSSLPGVEPAVSVIAARWQH